MTDELLPALSRGRGRHRSTGAAAWTRVVSGIVRNLYTLPPSLRFFAEPFEVWLAIASLFTGFSAALGRTRPATLAAQLPTWLLHVWGVLLCLGAVATLVARWRIGRPQTDLGLRSARSLEVLGQVLLATAVGVYATAILLLGLPGVAAGSVTAAAAWSFGVRAWIVSRELKRERAEFHTDG